MDLNVTPENDRVDYTTPPIGPTESVNQYASSQGFAAPQAETHQTETRRHDDLNDEKGYNDQWSQLRADFHRSHRT
ncbi:MAG: hypothetical protein AAGF54_19455, partial [Pseudomonadota bacterium]